VFSDFNAAALFSVTQHFALGETGFKFLSRKSESQTV